MVAFTASCSNEVVRGVKVAIVVLFELKVVLFELNEVPGKSLEKVVSTDSSWFKVVIEVSASSVDGSLSPTS